jgi:hypothetical protein
MDKAVLSNGGHVKSSAVESVSMVPIEVLLIGDENIVANEGLAHYQLIEE